MGTSLLAAAMLLTQITATGTGSISGRVLATTGAPAVNARVQIIEASPKPGTAAAIVASFYTDAAGTYRIDNIPPGPYYVGAGTVETPSYFPGTTTINDATIVNIHNGESLAGFDFKLVIPIPMKVTGRVNLPDGVAQSLLRLTGPRAMTTQSGTDGSFQFLNVPAGDYEVAVMATRPASSVSILPVRITLVDRDISGLELGLSYATIAVSIDVEGGGPKSRFKLTLTTDSKQATSYSMTPQLTINLLPGSYQVAVSGLPDGFSVTSIRTGTTELLNGGVLTAASKEVRDLTISLGVTSPPPWVKVRGRVTGPEQQNVRTVELNSAAMLGPAVAIVAADGSFEFPMIMAGTYSMRPSPLKDYFPKTLTVGRDEITNADIAPPTTQDLTGDFVSIQPGEFMMGCSPGDPSCLPEEMPSHKVRITKGFEIGRYEVTQMQWQALMGSNPSQFKGETLPVENINTWAMVEVFLGTLNRLNDGYRYRIPTEAEWEYAARAGSTAAAYAPIDSIAWHGGNSMTSPSTGQVSLASGLNVSLMIPTHPVGELLPNAWGLYDMQGNVWEWTSDWYAGDYFRHSPEADPRGPDSGPMRVMKGGSAVVVPEFTRVSMRGNQPPSNTSYIFGVRLVRERMP
jgi:formylglycine-generating enzyme required for sulfatase activity